MDEVLVVHRDRSAPQLEAIRARLELTGAQIRPRGAMAEPIRCCRNQ